VEDVDLRNNLVSDSRGFQIGYSHYYRDLGEAAAVMAARRIVLDYNLSDDRSGPTYPLSVGWGPNDFASAWAITGDPRPECQDADGSGGDIGALAAGAAPEIWRASDFLLRLELD
jgi:hypothetical protein